MDRNAVIAANEEATLLISRLDTRLSASPVAEAWQVRACIRAACAMADVDGTPTRPSDVAGIMMGAALPVVASYGPAHVGFAHWRRCMAMVDLGDLASRLVGRTASRRLRAAEIQEDWDAEDAMGPAARAAVASAGEGEDPDAYALGVAERSLDVLRGCERNGAVLVGLAAGLREAVRIDPDPGYFDRIWEVRRAFEARVDSTAEGDDPAVRERADRIKEAVSWERPAHLGACFGVVPDRLQELGFTRSRVSCLTGATKRLGFDRRLDDAALLGFLRRLSSEAREGIALLDAIEALVADIAGNGGIVLDPRTRMADVLYGVLLLPAIDAKWVEAALDMPERNARRLVQRLAETGIIVPWGTRRHSPADGQRTREMRLWTAACFERVYDRAVRRRRAGPGSVKGVTFEPEDVVGRARDVDLSVPMSAVFARFDGQMVDVDREFGRFWSSSARPSGPAPRA